MAGRMGPLVFLFGLLLLALSGCEDREPVVPTKSKAPEAAPNVHLSGPEPGVDEERAEQPTPMIPMMLGLNRNEVQGLLGEACEHSSPSGRVAWMVENALDWALEAPHGGAARDMFVIPTFAWLLIGDLRQADSVCDRAIAEYDRDEYREDRKLRSLPAMAHLMRGVVRYVTDQDGAARGAWNEAKRIAGKRQPVRKKARAFIDGLAK